MIEFYQDKRRSKTPPYAVFQADDADTNITLYESGKVVFQGNNADIDANIWKDMEKSFNNRDIDAEIKQKEDKKAEKKEDAKDLRFINVATIGSDGLKGKDDFLDTISMLAYIKVWRPSESVPYINPENDTGLYDEDMLPIDDSTERMDSYIV